MYMELLKNNLIPLDPAMWLQKLEAEMKGYIVLKIGETHISIGSIFYLLFFFFSFLT